MRNLRVNFKSFSQIVKEFIKALGQSRTYNLSKNWHCFFGILWGLPVPFVTIGLDLYVSHLDFTLSNIIVIITAHPFHSFFILHPLLFGIVFGAMGTIRHNKEQKIRELNRLKSNFLSMVSHELRTPLTTILGYITFLRTEKVGSLNKAQKDCLEISEAEGELLNRLIEELLDLSRIESGQFRVNLEAVNINETITRAINSLRLFANDQGVSLESKLPKDLPLVLADKERIMEVIVNLIENGIKFNKRAGQVLITASYGAQDNKIIFSVSDTGIGIAQGELEKIFDSFYQVCQSRNRKYNGCGLGLAISRTILKLHRGNIWAESKAGEGSTFYFELLKYRESEL